MSKAKDGHSATSDSVLLSGCGVSNLCRLGYLHVSSGRRSAYIQPPVQVLPCSLQCLLCNHRTFLEFIFSVHYVRKQMRFAETRLRGEPRNRGVAIHCSEIERLMTCAHCCLKEKVLHSLNCEKSPFSTFKYILHTDIIGLVLFQNSVSFSLARSLNTQALWKYR